MACAASSLASKGRTLNASDRNQMSKPGLHCSGLPEPAVGRGLLGLFRRCEDHQHRTAFHGRLLLDGGDVVQLADNPVHLFTCDLRVSNLTTPEANPYLDLHTILQPAPRVADLERE